MQKNEVELKDTDGSCNFFFNIEVSTYSSAVFCLKQLSLSSRTPCYPELMERLVRAKNSLIRLQC